MLEIFRHRLKVAREDAHITQEELARRVDSTRSTISGYEADGKEPDYKTLLNICRVLGVSADYLLGLTDNPSHRSAAPSSDPVDALRRRAEGLSRPLRSAADSSVNDVCAMLSPDVESRDAVHIRLYSRLLSILSSQRTAVRECVNATGGQIDVSAMAEIMALQSELKSTVSSILDQLLQADLESVSGGKIKDDTGYLDEQAI